eukprot:EG_transcript_46396
MSGVFCCHFCNLSIVTPSGQGGPCTRRKYIDRQKRLLHCSICRRIVQTTGCLQGQHSHTTGNLHGDTHQAFSTVTRPGVFLRTPGGGPASGWQKGCWLDLSCWLDP